MADIIASELKDIVRFSLELLGKAIEVEYGRKTYDLVEKIRLQFKSARKSSLENSLKTNAAVLEILSRFTPSQRFQVTHSFAVSLEIINACENAYRSSRLKSKAQSHLEHPGERITYVLTAHPTESRSPECIAIMTDITALLIKMIEERKPSYHEELLHLLLLALKTPVSRTQKPEVADEADYIYTTALRKDLILSMIDNLNEKRTVYLRSWVGGDKDGHPGINDKVMLESLQGSRKHLYAFALELLNNCERDSSLISPPKDSDKLTAKLKILKKALNVLQHVKVGDGAKLSLFKKNLKELDILYLKLIHTESPHLKKLKKLLLLFPGLVLPLELRESSQLIGQDVATAKGPIAGMLKAINSVSKGGNPLWYARALVISSTESSQHIVEAHLLMKKCMGKHGLPLVPLFESRNSLLNAEAILKETFQNKEILELCRKEWSAFFEVMLGYSDSAKENGSLLSRSLIREALYTIEKFLLSINITPIFFHGSGGSVARGGGSLDEQVSWWPLSARKIFKVTLQGEMVYRSFSMPEIFNSQLKKILLNSSKAQTLNTHPASQKNVLDFALKVSKKYQDLVFNTEFLEVVEKSTPYTYLNELKIGSRPSKRSQSLGIDTLRAIPWVLCWTQIRSLLPIWWGIGSSYAELTAEEKKQLQVAFKEDAFFSSFIKLLAFSLAKIDLSIWFSYLQNSKLSPQLITKYKKLFLEEYQLTISFIKSISGEDNILWFRPWLENSITLRSTMIHPLNMAQIVALKNSDAALLRESVTGIASGMLTTG
ncbi:MAG: phosphoenolpyruvate carboxylase [Bdellovibrionota bacterium]